MAHYENEVRMATTQDEIECMMKMARDVMVREEKKKNLNTSIPEERRFIEIVLEKEFPGPASGTDFAPAVTEPFDIRELTGADTASAFRLTVGVNPSIVLPGAALHIFAFTYNADGPRRPVGVGDTVFARYVGEPLDNSCTIRKAMLDTWHLGVLVTFILEEDGAYQAVTQIVSLNTEQEAYFDKERRNFR